ncbi:MAG: SipW-dependent-type signal peptide-containing protein [Microbacteriaceae bacterium]
MSRTTENEVRAPRTPTSDRRRIALAILAGGAVLGVGAAITLAVWNDSEFATGTFSSGQFDLEGSTDGTAFSSSPVAPGKTLTFEVDADLLSPGDVVYAPFALQLSADSDYEAVIDLSNSTANGAIGAELTYSLYAVTAFGATCSEGTPPTGAALVTGRAADAAGVVDDVLTLTAAEAPQNLCFVVTAGDVPQGAEGTVTWEFAGTSGDPL